MSGRISPELSSLIAARKHDLGSVLAAVGHCAPVPIVFHRDGFSMIADIFASLNLSATVSTVSSGPKVGSCPSCGVCSSSTSVSAWHRDEGISGCWPSQCFHPGWCQEVVETTSSGSPPQGPLSSWCLAGRWLYWHQYRGIYQTPVLLLFPLLSTSHISSVISKLLKAAALRSFEL